MSYASAQDFGMGAGFTRYVAPGQAEVEAFVKSIYGALGVTFGTTYSTTSFSHPMAPLCFDKMTGKSVISKAQADVYMRKWEELKIMYPEATAKVGMAMCMPTIYRNPPQMTWDEYYKQNLASTTVNLDMSPAVNTVADGTPGSWNVSGTQKSGSIYSYNFVDKAAAQTYAQAVVDSGGTATMYQVPVSAPPPTDPWSNITAGVPPTTISPVEQGGYPVGNALMQTCKVGMPCNGITTGGTPTPPGVYVPPQTAMTPDDMYTSPILPQQPQAAPKSNAGMMALLLAIPAGAAWYFFNK